MPFSKIEANIAEGAENYKSVWSKDSKQIEKETSFSSGREDDLLTSQPKHFWANSRSSSAADLFEYSEEVYEQEKSSWRRGKAEGYSALTADAKAKKADPLVKRKDAYDEDSTFDSDDELAELLKVSIFSIRCSSPCCTHSTTK